MALRYNLHVNQGETWELTVPLVAATPEADFSGSTVVGQIRADPASTVILHEWSAAANNIDVQPLAVVLNIPAAVSSAWTWRRGVYSVELAEPTGGATIRLVEGWVFVTPETCR